MVYGSQSPVYGLRRFFIAARTRRTQNLREPWTVDRGPWTHQF